MSTTSMIAIPPAMITLPSSTRWTKPVYRQGGVQTFPRSAVMQTDER